MITIDYNILIQPIFWTITLIMCLPFGMVLESIYSLLYRSISEIVKNLAKISKKEWIHLPHFIATKCYKNYKEHHENLDNVNYIADENYQQILSENNIIRNLWISSLFGLIFALIYKYISATNTIDQTNLFIWLPIIILLMLIANVRTEVLIKKRKSGLYYYQQIKDKGEH